MLLVSLLSTCMSRIQTVTSSFFSDGSWSKTNSNGGWATVAIVDNIIIRCKAGYSNITDSALEEELKGLIAALQIAKELGSVSAQIFLDSTDTIWS